MSNLLKKMFSIALCAALVGGAAAAMPVVAPDSGITANAADTITYGIIYLITQYPPHLSRTA